MKKIIVDTNFLMIPGQFKVDVFSEIDRVCDFSYHIIIIDKSRQELERLSEGTGKKARAARLALKLLKQKKIKAVKTKDKHADDAIVNLAGKDTLVATQDKELKKRVKEKGAKIITLRSKSRLIIQ